MEGNRFCNISLYFLRKAMKASIEALETETFAIIKDNTNLTRGVSARDENTNQFKKAICLPPTETSPCLFIRLP